MYSRDELEEHKIPPQGVGDPPDLLQPVRPPIYEEPDVRVVELTREPNSALGIIIEGGKVGTEDLGLRGIFIRHIDMSSPAARVGTLLTGDQILEVRFYLFIYLFIYSFQFYSNQSFFKPDLEISKV